MPDGSLKADFVSKYVADGEQKFYRFLLIYAVNKLACIEAGEYKGINPELEFLSYYDKFIIMYRRTGDEVHFNLAKLFRKTAHRVYRIMLRKKMTVYNSKFLNLV